jgi:hypothetical protein
MSMMRSKTEKPTTKSIPYKNQCPFFQAKLTVGPTNDVYEKEADAVADQLMRMPINKGEAFLSPRPLSIRPLVQSKCAACEEDEKRAQLKSRSTTIQRDETEETPAPERAPEPASTFRFESPFQSRTTPDFLGLRQPFINRGIFHLWEPDSALQVWNYNFNFFHRLGLAPDTATTFSNFTAPFFIDSQLKVGNPTWWEITDRDMNTTTFNASLPVLEFNADFSPVAPGWFRTIFQSGGSSGIQRKCASCEKEENAQRKENENTEAPDIVDHAIHSGGSPMDDDTQSFMENRFGYDFGHVKIHNDSLAASSAQSINALAYTSGNDIVFNQGQYSPDTTTGKKLLAHELTHVVQQSSSIQPKKIQRTSLAQFRADLAAISPDHATVITELFAHPSFIPMVNYLNGCPAGTIDFDVTRITQRIRGRDVDLFGGFSPGFGGLPSSMVVNPHRREHATNPLEVVDTIVHEFIHAILDLNSTCTSAANPFPLPATVLDAPRDPELTGLPTAGGDRTAVASASAAGRTTTSGQNLLEYFDSNYGPSASRPETHYVDMNRAGLSLVTSIISSIRAAHPTIGQETVSFDNVELMQAADLLPSRSWWNATQRSVSMRLHKNSVARKRKIDPSTFTDREYDISAIQAVEFADSFTFDANSGGGWGPVGGVWECHKRSRFTGRMLHTYVTGTPANRPGGAVPYQIIQHT